MRKILFAASAGALFLFLSCNDTTKDGSGTSSQAQKNLEASRTVGKAFETGDASKIDSVVSSDFVDHTDRGDMGRDSLKAMVAQAKQSVPDMKVETIREVADDEYVFAWLRFTGTSNGGMGMPKGPFNMTSIEVSRHDKDGKIVEHWGFMEPREFMKMMSSMPGTPTGDTTKPR